METTMYTLTAEEAAIYDSETAESYEVLPEIRKRLAGQGQVAIWHPAGYQIAEWQEV